MQNNEDSIAAKEDITDVSPVKEGNANIINVNDPVSRADKMKEIFSHG